MIKFLKKKTKAKPVFKAYQGSEPAVFVSYSHADSDIVYPIIKELHDMGALLWYDEGIDAGEVWSEKIADKISGCSKFMLFVSPNSIKSRHVKQEINFANSKHKHFLPVYIKPANLTAGLEMTLSVFQAIYYYTYRDNLQDFYKQLHNALSAGPNTQDAETTHISGKTRLRLDDGRGGDGSLPAIIHLPDSGTFSIGRFDVSVGIKQSDFEFPKNTANISRRHAVFEHSPQGPAITDVGSKAGTWVNGKPIQPHIPTALSHGCTVSFGNAGADYIFEH